MADISIIICTYNPDMRLLERCLHSVSGLETGLLNVEYLLIDNNSNPAIAGSNAVRQFLNQNNKAKLVVEKNAGLTHARICGFNNSTAPVIIFFDDDNEPYGDYLAGTMDFLKRHPEAGIFSPGKIAVEFTDGAQKWIKRFADVYQEIDLQQEMLGAETGGYPHYYPYGTGMVVRREIMEAYANLVEGKAIATMGRQGKLLTGGEDVQIVLLGINMGYHAGRTPLLKLKHLINGDKANFGYLKRLAYGGGLSSLPAQVEIFPGKKDKVIEMKGVTLKLIIALSKAILLHIAKPRRLILAIAWQTGYFTSIYTVKEKSPSGFLVLIKLITGLR